MDKAAVIKFRDTVRSVHPNLRVRLFCDNAILMDESEGWLKWDDENETVTCVRHNQDQLKSPHEPIEIIQTTYELIQYIVAFAHGNNYKELLKACGYSDDVIPKIQNDLMPTKDLYAFGAVPEDVLEAKKEQAEEEQTKFNENMKAIEDEIKRRRGY